MDSSPLLPTNPAQSRLPQIHHPLDHLTETQAIDAIRERASQEPWLFGFIIDDCIKDYHQMRSSGLIPEPPPPFQSETRCTDLVPAPDSVLDTPAFSQLLSMFQPPPDLHQEPADPAQESGEESIDTSHPPAEDSG